MKRLEGKGIGPMQNGITIEAFIKQLADRILARLRPELAQLGNGGAIRPRLLSIKQAAVYLGRSEEAVSHMVSSGKIPAVRGDRRILIDLRDLDRWIESNKQQEQQP